MIINRLRVPIATARQMDDTIAKVEKQNADIEYVAMMADIDIPSEEDNSNVSED